MNAGGPCHAALIGLITLGFAGSAAGQSREELRYPTGLISAPPEVYASFPSTPVFRAFLPERVNLSSRFPVVGDQKTQGSCVGWAVAYAARSYYSEAIDGQTLADPDNVASPAYVFNSIAQPGCQGSVIAEALNLLKTGALSHAAYPYDDSTCSLPSAEHRERATVFRIRDWLALDSTRLDQIKGELAAGNPVVVGAQLYDSFFAIHDGKVYSDPEGEQAGRHAMVVVGFDESRQAFRLLNSWGTEWGQKGFAWVGYDAFSAMVSEAYVMRLWSDPRPPDNVDPKPPPLPEPDVPPLPVVKCGSIEVLNDGRGIVGFVGERAELDAIKTFAEANKLASAVELRPWPQCEILLTLAHAIRQEDGPKVVATTASPVEEGSYFGFDVVVPRRASFLHVAYIQADGVVVNLLQSDMSALRQFRGSETITFGNGAEGPRLRVSPPFGEEVLIVMASASPLFEAPRPKMETEREFLTALRRVLTLREQTGGGSVSASYAVVTTVEKT